MAPPYVRADHVVDAEAPVATLAGGGIPVGVERNEEVVVVVPLGSPVEVDVEGDFPSVVIADNDVRQVSVQQSTSPMVSWKARSAELKLVGTRTAAARNAAANGRRRSGVLMLEP
jgi:hypothetical protein